MKYTKKKIPIKVCSALDTCTPRRIILREIHKNPIIHFQQPKNLSLRTSSERECEMATKVIQNTWNWWIIQWLMTPQKIFIKEPFRESQVWIVGSKRLYNQYEGQNGETFLPWLSTKNRKNFFFLQIDWTRRLKSSFILNSRVIYE